MPNGEGSGISEDAAKEKWADNTDAEDWKKGIGYAEEHDNYKSGVAAFLGVNTNQVSDEVQTDWTDAVNSDRATDNYNNHTGTQQANKWLNNYASAETGGEANE